VVLPDGADARQERKGRLAARFVLCSFAIGIMVLAWQRSHDEPDAHPPSPWVEWIGKTSQDQPIRIRAYKHEVRSIATRLHVNCRDGHRINVHFVPLRSDITQHGDLLLANLGPTLVPGRDSMPVRFRAHLVAGLAIHMSGSIGATVSGGPQGKLLCAAPGITFETVTSLSAPAGV
jgi:hypothetical protein